MGQTQDNFLVAMEMSKVVTAVPTIPTTPLAEFPTPQEIVDVSFGFSQKLLNQQQDFVEKLIAAGASRTEPMTAKNAPPARSKSASN